MYIFCSCVSGTTVSSGGRGSQNLSVSDYSSNAGGNGGVDFNHFALVQVELT